MRKSEEQGRAAVGFEPDAVGAVGGEPRGRRCWGISAAEVRGLTGSGAIRIFGLGEQVSGNKHGFIEKKVIALSLGSSKFCKQDFFDFNKEGTQLDSGFKFGLNIYWTVFPKTAKTLEEILDLVLDHMAIDRFFL